MNSKTEIAIGSFVQSVAGGDEGKTYLVVGFAKNGYALIVDGARHKLALPKKKNVRHVKPNGNSIELLPKTDAAVVTAVRRNKI